MIKVRPEHEGEYAEVRKVIVEAFKQVNEADLVEAIRESEDFIPELSLVADKDGEVVGHIMFSPIKIETSDGEAPILTLAPVAVRPAFQNQGVGSELVRKGLEECRRLGHRIVVVVGHPHYYPRFGFVPARAKGLEASLEVPNDAFTVLELEPGALEGISGVVRFPKAFETA